MARSFEELVAWQKARHLTKRIYEVTNIAPFSRDFALRNQIRDASVSIMSNIAEGFERYRDGEFHQYLSTSKASCAEVRSDLYVASDAAYISPEVFGSLIEECSELSRIIGKLRATVEERLALKKRSSRRSPSTQHSALSTDDDLRSSHD